MRRLRRDVVAIGSAVVLLVIVVASVFAPALAGHDPNTADLANVVGPPTGDHPLGGDGSGRDVLARLLYSGRTSLLGGLISTAVALLIGVPAGLVGGYFGRWPDAVANWVANLVMALPGVVVLLALVAVDGPSLVKSMALLGFLLSPSVYRLVRGAVQRVRGELYVDAARVSGLSDWRIIRRHVLLVVRSPIIIMTPLLFGLTLMVQAGIDFLGIGEANTPSWGAMLNDASAHIFDNPLLSVWPGMAIAVTALSVMLLGTSIRDALDDVTPPVRAATKPVRATGAPIGDALLSIEDLRVSYPTPRGDAAVVDSVTLTVHKGEIVGLVGETGCGKTQTALAVLGLLPETGRVTAGRVCFAGVELTGMSDRELNTLRGRRIGYISQEPMANLDPSFRIGSQLTEPMRIHLGLSKKEARRRVLELLARVGIGEPERIYRAFPHEISGGTAQRVLIAGAVSCEPDLLIADEPTTALDVTVQAEVLDLLRSLQQERGMGVVLVTHDFGVVADICDRVAVMYSGELVEVSPAAELFTRPAHPYTAALIAANPETAVDRGPLPTIPDRVPSPLDRPPGCRFAPRCAYARPECAEHPGLDDLRTGAVRCVRAHDEVIEWAS